MKHIVIRNLSQPEANPVSAVYCASFLCRLKGLTFRRNLAPDFGLLLVFNRESRLDTSIHMMFVFMDLVVIWLNQALQVVDLKLARSWRPLYIPGHSAKYVLEMPPERFPDFKIGDQVQFNDS